MDPTPLAAMIAADRAAGLVPFFVCATHGTTSSMAFDPTPTSPTSARRHRRVAARRRGDERDRRARRPSTAGSTTGSSAPTATARTRTSGWASTSTATCTGRPTGSALLGALSILPEYLRSAAAETGAAIDYRDWQVPLGRRFRALKLWMTLRLDGVEAIQTMIRRHVELTQRLAGMVAPTSASRSSPRTR